MKVSFLFQRPASVMSVSAAALHNIRSPAMIVEMGSKRSQPRQKNMWSCEVLQYPSEKITCSHFPIFPSVFMYSNPAPPNQICPHIQRLTHNRVPFLLILLFYPFYPQKRFFPFLSPFPPKCPCFLSIKNKLVKKKKKKPW